MTILNRLKADWNKTKEEVILGGVGGVVSYFVYARFYNINPLRAVALLSQGIIDRVITTIPVESLATLKVQILFIFAGAVLGFIVGKLYDPFTFLKK